MTNLTTIDLTTLNLKNLQALAKDLKIKSWWTMKKADLLIALEEEKLNQGDDEAVRKANEEYQKELLEKDQKTEDSFNKGKEPKSKKSRRPKGEKDQDNLVTIKELAAEFGMKGTKARRLLRNETAARPYGGNRWEWDCELHKEALEAARSILKAHTK